MVFELIYLTNDDDERYSIQAHEVNAIPLFNVCLANICLASVAQSCHSNGFAAFWVSDLDVILLNIIRYHGSFLQIDVKVKLEQSIMIQYMYVVRCLLGSADYRHLDQSHKTF